MIDKYEELLKEYFDYSDKGITSYISEAGGRDRMLGALTNKLYEKILEKYDKIDFTSVSRSRGDITKIDKYDSLKECIDIIYELVKEYKQDTYAVDVLNTTIANLRNRTTMFKKAFNMNCGIGIMTYNTMALGVVECTNFLISGCIEYIKSPNNDSFKMALDTVAYNNTKQNLLFESLEAFNVSISTGEFDKAIDVALDTSLRKYHEAATEIQVDYDTPFIDADDHGAEYQPPTEPKPSVDNLEKDPADDEHPTDDSEGERVIVHDVKEAGVGDFIKGLNSIKSVAGKFTDPENGPIGQVGQLLVRAYYFFTKALIPAIRSLVYFYYANRQKKSDEANEMAQLIQMHMLELQQDTSIDIEHRKKILEKQEKYYQHYIKKRDKYAINFNVSKKSVEKMIKDDDRKFNSLNLNPDSPTYDTSNSALF